MLDVIKLIRVPQWLKNMFVFLPMFFSGHLTDPAMWGHAVVAFFSFSLIASSIYVLNDVRDVEADRIHPTKRFRPIASGKVSVAVAWCVMALLVAGSYALLMLLPGGGRMWCALIVSAYFVLNILYCFRLKQIAILDVFIISTGFVLRVALGGVACGIWVSPWIICMTFILALFLAFAKRRDDMVIAQEKGIVTRANIVNYNLAYLDQVLGLLGGIAMVCYIIYSVQPDVERRLHSNYVYISSIFVLFGILRYLQISLVDKKSGSPTKILTKDRFIQLSVIGWIAYFVLIIYCR